MALAKAMGVSEVVEVAMMKLLLVVSRANCPAAVREGAAELGISNEVAEPKSNLPSAKVSRSEE